MIEDVRRPRDTVILAYHRVNEVRPDALSVRTSELRRQLSYLLDAGYRNLSLEELSRRLRRERPPRERCFAITFDDGYRDGLTDALPVLRELGCTATFFLTADYLGSGRPFPWDEGKFPALGPLDLALDDREVGALLEAGMSIGSHTCSHPLLATVPLARARDEIERSKAVLEARFGVPVRTFCYPAGSLNDAVVECVAQAGYVAGVVTPPRPGIRETLFTLRRVGVYQGSTLGRFRLRVHPLWSRLRDAAWELRGAAGGGGRAAEGRS
ncbi:polysaccharide deacetylase family protein [Anaeromyxobacter paludicola]|uniref:NodB homology domain-containing protein n=1 Tax=Anaeromyxobacter paludicola TaxID=2918171 RepID=A0ABM7X9J1_9BACT|nr:polysaccharide deacetylase family protein [Anaeromyxobacter paludicola]BDG08519.1 hypothetical protein AMPC_16320 [Anaeromyxobacter paludicola]